MATQSHSNVAAIDFGTSFCSLSYSINGGNVEMLPINDNDKTRVPTAILLKRNREDDSILVIDIGGVAQQKHADLPKSEHKEHIYFECFKMQLRNEEKISREMKITAFAHKDFYLLEVIALVLQYLRTRFEKYLSKKEDARRYLKAKDFSWVITVPAIWKHRGKQLMREAAYRAGLLSDKVDPITSLTLISESLEAIDMTDCADRLTLALEPECAAFFCQSLSNDMIAEHSRQGYTSYTSKNYMVLDIGGGTVDIAIHELTEDGKIRSVLQPKGNDYGGTKVNQKFSELLQKIVKDEGFSRFYKEPNNDLIEAAHRAAITELVFQKFETHKTHFGECLDRSRNQKAFIRLNAKFVNFYGEDTIKAGIEDCQDERIQYDDSAIIIHFSYMRELFDEVTKEITACMKEALDENPITIDTVYLVGGFGGSEYIFEKVKANLPDTSTKVETKVIVPIENKLAVCKGAVLFQQSPSVIQSRISDAYYGLSIREPYNPDKHPSTHILYNKSLERYDCRDVFRIFIKKGQTVYHSDYFEDSFLPDEKTTYVVTLRVYRTLRDDIKYAKDGERRPIKGVEYIGGVTLKTPSRDLPYEQRKLKVKFHYGGTELKVSGLYIPTNEEVHAAFDPEALS